jgi:hypothetical protein
LDEVWNLFSNPIPAIRSAFPGCHNIPSHAQVYTVFSEAFSDHPIINKDSPHHMHLKFLGHLMDTWSNSGGPTHHFGRPIKSRRKPRQPASNFATASSLAPLNISDAPHLVFLQFLCSVFSAIHDLKDLYNESTSAGKQGIINRQLNSLVRRILVKPDFLLPFREHAPT